MSVVGCLLIIVVVGCRSLFPFLVPSSATQLWRVLLATEQHTEWQWPLSGVPVHSIMMVKSAQPGEGWDFTLSTITSKVVVYGPAERSDTLPLFILYSYMYSVDLARPSPNSDKLYTDKKENQIFLIYKEFQSGEVAKSNMRKGFLIF